MFSLHKNDYYSVNANVAFNSSRVNLSRMEMSRQEEEYLPEYDQSIEQPDFGRDE